jgi:hypothetical protein
MAQKANEDTGAVQRKPTLCRTRLVQGESNTRRREPVPVEPAIVHNEQIWFSHRRMAIDSGLLCRIADGRPDSVPYEARQSAVLPLYRHRVSAVVIVTRDHDALALFGEFACRKRDLASSSCSATTKLICTCRLVNLRHAGADARVGVWDADTGQPIGDPLTGHTGAVSSVAFSPDGTRIVSGSDDHTLRLWPAVASPADL